MNEEKSELSISFLIFCRLFTRARQRKKKTKENRCLHIVAHV